MKIDRLTPYLCSAFLLAAMLSCGGGGIGGTGFRSVGAITAMGSITVNDVVFDTEGARVFLNDEPADPGDLRVGMVVEVEGILHPSGLTGFARTVRFNGVLEGPITRIDEASGVMEVLGRRVWVDEATRFDEPDGGLFLLGVGDVTEISGHIDDAGAVRATFIRVTGEGRELATTGMITSRTDFFFRIGALTVDFSSAVLRNFDADEPQEGDFVGVQGRVFDPASGILLAEVVKRKDLSLDAVEEIEVEGFIHGATPDGFIVVTPAGRLRVRISESTEFKRGDASHILSGNRVKVKGTITDGVAEALEVTFRRGGRSF